MFNSIRKRINNALQEATVITENLQQHYRKRVSSSDISLPGSCNSLSSSTLDLSLPTDVNTAAGCNLLAKYENDWKIIHQNNVDNSIKAQEIAQQIHIMENRMSDRNEVVTDLLHCLSDVPTLFAKIKSCRETLDNVHRLSQIINKELETLENLCGECELYEYISEKQCEISKYKQKKIVDLEVYRRKVVAEHQLQVQEQENHIKKVQKERHAVFDDAFHSDLEEFKRKGHIPKIHTSLNEEVALEDVILEDTESKDALEDFLNR